MQTDRLHLNKTTWIATTAMLASVVAVLEFGRLPPRIPFPLMPILKFDIVGIPMIVAYNLLGLGSGILTSIVSFAIIATRDPFSGAMKTLAEAAYILGAWIIMRRPQLNLSWKRKSLAIISSVAVRTIVTTVANVLLLPIFMGRFYPTSEAVMIIIPLLAAFNIMQGAISVIGGLLIYEGIKKRILVLRS
ncbi:ECF transporter S component [Candidatus Bathyarchaeota archaeon]|nr:ECF transporter S component [Candidatus Bathyarchaeota archaeon]